MNFENLLNENALVLTECAVSERLRRRDDVMLHPLLFNAPLIYQKNGRKRLEEIYFSYFEVARDACLPILLCAPTWKVCHSRIEEAGASETINQDAVAFLKNFREKHEESSAQIAVGGLLAPQNDCYLPAEALTRKEANDFHAWQIDELVEADAEVLIAQTMPAVSEALGMADRLAVSDKPYILSFVINKYGCVLDGTTLSEAMERIDQAVVRPPVGYMVNCVYPTFLLAEIQSSQFFKRCIGIQANASSKDHNELNGSELLQQDPLEDWGRNMIDLHKKFGMTILGGCCGTDHSYLQHLVDLLES